MRRDACSKSTQIKTYHDHRVAMSFSVLASKTLGTVIENPSCVAKTCPNFFEQMEQLGYKFRHIDKES